MAATRTQEASSSMSRCTYHAFLSFRGEDTRNNFTSHLYGALVQAGIHTFLDDDGIERGENIEAELQKAIKESKISIIVFSKDYASSRWCLDELVMIMGRRSTVGHTVVPVFYDVDPSQVRKQTGSFAEAFARHEKRFKEEMDKVEMWRVALKEVADLGGMVLGTRCEWQFVQNIVKEIGNKLNRPILNVATYIVGLDSRIKYINLWVQDGSNDVGIAMIYGIGGTGKTTIAKTVYNINYGRFQSTSFLGNVRETTKQPNGLVRLQGKLLSDILKRKTSKIQHVDEGIIKIKAAICCKRVLLVLDDVDQLDQLNAMVGVREWFYPGSKIIITTRHEHLEGFNEVCKKFKVEPMNDDESLQLFSWHAFKQDHPTEGYTKWSRKAVHQCRGLPLALEVLGSSLYNRETSFWESTVQKLEAIPLALQVYDSKIQNILRISYDSLQDDRRDLFLNIACFFIGKDKDYTVKILDKRDFCTTVGIQNLIDRCLMTVNKDNKLMMHQLLRDMGKEIIRQDSKNDLGKRSRLWCNEDAYTVLKEKIGSKTVKGLTLDLYKLMEDKRGKTTVNYAKRHYEQDYLDKSAIGNCSKRRRIGFFFWQPMDTAFEIHFPGQVALETKTFKKMHNLELLQLNYVTFSGDYEDFPKNLVWLCWHGFPLESIPTNFYLEKLVALDMRYSSLIYVWKETMFLAELKFLNLSHSHGLVRTPDFSRLPSLERLILKNCINLVEVNESIVNLDRLVLLNLKDCKSLRKLPKKIGMLKSLKKLVLSGCVKLDEPPVELGKMEVIFVDGIAINQLHTTTSDTKKLSLLPTTSWHSTFWSWFSPTRTPHSISLPHSLVSLSLNNCNLSDDVISCGLSSLPSLRCLNLSRNPFQSLPESITGHTMLEVLVLEGCTRLQSIPKFPRRLAGLMLDKCTSLERIPYPPFFPLGTSGCEKLVEVEGLFKLEPIKNADIAIIKSMGLSNLESLGSIEVHLHSVISGIQRKILQVLHECGISSIFLPGSDVPGCFSLKNTGSLISFHVPPLVGHKMRGLNVCTLYALNPEYGVPDPGYVEYDPHHVRINNKTKHMRWTYHPIFFAPPGEEVEDMLWLSHWNIGDQLEGGDEIDVSVVLPNYFKVKMCGICFVYEPEDKGTGSNIEETVLSDFPWFHTLALTQARADAYFHCHHSYITVQRKRLMDYHKMWRDGNVTLSPSLFDYLLERERETCIFCSCEDDWE